MNPAAQVSEIIQQRRGPVGVALPDDYHDHPDDRPDDGPGDSGERSEAAAPLEVHRNGALAGVVGVLASAVAILWLGRAAASGSPVEWALVGGMALVAVAHLRAALDARTPLLVADAHGVRVRLGSGWRGLPWDAVDEVEHRPRRGLLRDGRLAIVPREADRLLVDLDRRGRRQARLAQRLYGAPLGVPLGPATRLVGADGDVVAQLEALADPSVRIVNRPRRTAAPEHATAPETDAPETDAPEWDAPEWDAPESVTGADAPEAQDIAAWDDETQAFHAWEADAAREPEPAREADAAWEPEPAWDLEPAWEPEPAQEQQGDERADEQVPEQEPEQEAVPRGRDPRPWLARALTGRRARRLDARVVEDSVVEEVRVMGEPLPDHPVVGLTPGPETVERDATREEENGESTPPAAATPGEDDRVRPIARPGQAVAPLVVDEFQIEPAADPVVGPDIAAARTRLALTVDQLAERTRIRPHVIESIEVDDFAPCGGDFYARGHLRTLSRVLGIDVAPLLARYDERYADAPVDARRVFEAELASAGVRARRSRVRGGPNWSVLVAAFMAVVLCWSVAQLVLDTPPDVRPPTPTLRNGSAGVGNGAPAGAEPVPVLVGAVQGGATIEIQDGTGEIVFAGDVAYGESRAMDVAPPVQVTSDDGGAVEVTVAGEWRGRMGRLGESATQTYAATQ